MSLALVRLDDRLIHGQVVIAWVHALGAKHIVVVDDRVRANEWEQEIYRLGVPADLSVEFVTVADAREQASAWSEAPESIIVLIGDVDTTVRLCSESDTIKRVNLGGVHAGAERRQRLSYVYLSDAEASALTALSATGVEVSVQAVPTEAPVSLEKMLK